ncbi:MAG: glycosyltransferase family 39 protein, partial [Deltaproteobacteria bacterium]|nr:glycosyltransferase family 39 protein [Deltaproteobacteria bacterium]
MSQHFHHTRLKYYFWSIVVLNIFIRLINLDLPLLEGSATRQAQNAMSAAYFYEEYFSLLFPKIPLNGPSDYYHALEIQWIPYIVAFFYKISGGVYPFIFRIISIIFTFFTLILLFRFFAKFTSRSFALIGMFFFGLSPISIYLGRSAQYEMPIIFFTVATLYYFYHWIQTEQKKFLYLSCLGLFFAASLKIPTLHLLLPITYMMFKKWGWECFRKNIPLGMSLIAIIAVQCWLQYLRTLGDNGTLVHYDLSYNLERMRLMFLSADFYKNVYHQSLNYVLTPVGFVLFFLGLSLRKVHRDEIIFCLWLLGVGIFYILMPEQFGVHGYYHIHYLPIAAFFMMKPFIHLYRWSLSHKAPFNASVPIKVLISLFLICSMRYAIPFFKIPENKRYTLKAAEIAKQYIPR